MHEWFKAAFIFCVFGRYMDHPWWFISQCVSILPVTHGTLLAIDCLEASFDIGVNIILKWIYR